MALTISYVKIGNTSVAVMDQNVMNSTNITAGTTFEVKRSLLFYHSGGSMLVNVSGTDKDGNVYGYKSEEEAGTGNAGYYVNGTKIVAFTPGLGGVHFVWLAKDRSNKYWIYRTDFSSGAMGLYINGYNGQWSFTQRLSGWGNIIKLNMTNNADVQLRNNGDGGPTQYVLALGMGTGGFILQLYVTPFTPDDGNPYDPGGYSEPGGGDPNKQNWAEDSDVVTVDDLPDETYFGATAVGLVTIFTPTKAQLKKLADVLWGQGFFNFVQHMVQNIEDLFISLSMVPFTVPTGNTVEVTWFSYDIGGEVPVGTGIYLTLAARQWVEFNMGSIRLTGGENSSGFASDTVLDYSPYSKLGIYLPFIGYQELDIDECRGNVLTLIYRMDVLSGSCLAIIRVNGRDIYQFTGSCSVQIPLTSEDASAMFTNAISIATAAASAGSTAAVASAGNAFTQERVSAGKLSQSGADFQNEQRSAMVSNAEGSLVSATVQGVMGMKPNYKKSGAISGSTSLFGVKQPYLFLTTPRQSVPEHYQRYCGFPSNVTGKLSDFSGFTVVEDIRLNGLVATSSEVEEIYTLLKSGVII